MALEVTITPRTREGTYTGDQAGTMPPRVPWWLLALLVVAGAWALS